MERWSRIAPCGATSERVTPLCKQSRSVTVEPFHPFDDSCLIAECVLSMFHSAEAELRSH